MTGVAAGVATLHLNRPEKRNALSIQLRHDLTAALRAAGADPEVRCTLITAEPPAFCSGMDTTQFGGDEANRRAIAEASEAFATALVEHPKPLVAAVDGAALGGGFVLALLCDVRVAGPNATFGFPEVRRGIPASYAAARSALSLGVARDLCLSGRVVGAEEALALGIVTRLGDGADAAHEIAALPESGPLTAKRWMTADRAWLDEEAAALRHALGLG